MNSSDILQHILATKAQEISTNKKRLPLHALRAQAEASELRAKRRNFVDALETTIKKGKAGIIAEIKKNSPSKGILRPHFLPDEIARSYEEHGAACISVLTDYPYFQGTPEHLQQARMACSVPILRKDFLLEEYQLYEAAVWGADCILLIATVLDKARMQALESLADELGLAVLVEIHNENELEQALLLKTPLLGINNRNLRTFHVSLNTTVTLLPYIPKERLVISASGILTHDDVKFMYKHNVKAFLVGEAMMRADNPGQALSDLFS